MKNQAEVIDDKQTQQDDLGFLWGWLAALAGLASMCSYTLSKHGWNTIGWLTEDCVSDAPSDAPIYEYKYFPAGDYEPFLIVFVFSLWSVFQSLHFYLFMKYIEIWIPISLFRFIRSTIVPAISVLAARHCGDDPLLFGYFVLSAASGLFFSLALRMPEDLRFTEPLVSLALGFLVYFRQNLVFNIFLVIYSVDVWFMNMSHVKAKNENVPSRPNMHDRNPTNRGPIETGCGQNTQLSAEACAQGKEGSLSPERHGKDLFSEVPKVPEHEMILRVREGHGTLYVKKCDTIFLLNDKILSLVRLIISWILEKSLARTLSDSVVHDAEFASQDLDLLVQYDHGVLYLKRCGIRLSIEGENLASLIQIMKSFYTSQSLPHMLSSTTTLGEIPLLSCLPRAFHGSEVLRLRKWLLGDPQKCLMEEMLFRADDPMQFHERAWLIEHSHENQFNNRQHDLLNEVVKRSLTYHEEQDGSSNGGGTDLQGQAIVGEAIIEVEQCDSRDCVSQVNVGLVCHEEQDGVSTNGGGDPKDMFLHVQRLPIFLLLGFLVYEIFS